MSRPLQLSAHIEEWAVRAPFRITGYCWNSFRLVVVELSDGHHVGRGEGLPVYYLRETADSLYQQIEAAAVYIERGIDCATLLDAMPPGGARNAVDCALWDLEAKRRGKSVWELSQIRPTAVTTAFTIGIED